ncbi:Myozenin-3 [Varanus komodoensis]|uniref:myozenin-3 n=1 Tax=Varanus komodoensis TaxID=61221 RepID=UPI001CF7D540|nr:myozenin-3 [Varanus komodoensis]KAF7249389.1 Myozenin-3 [Varanus komodoensis]
MFPLLRSDHSREQNAPVHAIVKEKTGGDAPQLDLGKKVSVPQDLMMEELSLPINRGSRLYQQRQKRVQRFVLEHPTGYRAALNRISGAGGDSHGMHNGEAAEGWMSVHNAENIHAQLQAAGLGKGAPPRVLKKTDKVLRMSKALNPESLAPGYAGPLKEVPPEKFNRTAIPKGYQSPWQEFLSHEDYQRDRENALPEPVRKVDTISLRSFNRTPTPFGGLLLNDVFLGFPDMAEAQTDAMNSLEILSRRPNFNRAPRGWILVMPESEDL